MDSIEKMAAERFSRREYPIGEACDIRLGGIYPGMEEHRMLLAWREAQREHESLKKKSVADLDWAIPKGVLVTIFERSERAAAEPIGVALDELDRTVLRGTAIPLVAHCRYDNFQHVIRWSATVVLARKYGGGKEERSIEMVLATAPDAEPEQVRRQVQRMIFSALECLARTIIEECVQVLPEVVEGAEGADHG